MHMHWQCGCGHVAHGDSEDEIVRKAQEHMRKDHGKEVSREEVLKAAKAASH